MSLSQENLEKLAEDHFVAIVLHWPQEKFVERRDTIRSMLENGYEFVTHGDEAASGLSDAWINFSAYPNRSLRNMLKAIDLVEPLSEADRMSVKEYRCRDFI